ncbi:MAG: VWA domain-containing protein, partial [Phycisphaerales bacterium]|nr:VWA domain-containing protein [Phycisphaerales bacterium]
MIDRFAHPELLLLLIPGVLCLVALRRRHQSVRLNTLRLETTWRSRLAVVPAICRSLAVVLLVVALARPQEQTGETKTSTEGVAMQIVIDRSSSMGELMVYDGIEMRRLDVVKRVMREFVLGNDDDLEGRPDDMIGLITFAQFAETIAPLSRARDAVVE